MEQYTIEIEARSETGSRAARRFRNEGKIPSIVFHRGDPSISAYLDEKQFSKVAKMSGPSQVFLLKSNDSHLNGKSAIVREIRKDYLKNKLLHVDFQALKDDEAITIRVPVEFVGEAYGVKTEGGVLSVALHEISISCVPKLIPAKITVDVSKLNIGSKVTLADITVADGVTLLGDKDEAIVSVIHAMKEEEAKPAVEAAVTPEAGAAAAAPGAADAAPAAKGKEEKK